MRFPAFTQPAALAGKWLKPLMRQCCLVWGLWWMVAALAQTNAQALTHTLTTAELVSLSGIREVKLPHKLNATDFPAQGGLVRYTLRVDLPQAPAEPLAIYVNKLSKSGRVKLNGLEVNACALGRLEEIRCLNQPLLFLPPLAYWREGINEVEIEVHANRLQPNGMSAVLVGEAEALDTQVYQPAQFWRVDTLNMLAWVSLILGLFSFAIAWLIPGQRLFLWVGLNGITGALAKATLLQTHPWVSVDFFVWLAYASRLVGIPFMLLAILGFFDQQGWMRKLQRPLLIYTLVAMLVMWFTHLNATAVSLVYLPVVALSVGLLLAISLWTWQDPKPRHLLITAVVMVLVVIGIADWLRFNGAAGFDVLLLMPYAHSGLSLVFYGVLLSMVGDALKASQMQEQLLQDKVAERTQALQAVHQQLTAIEVERSAQAERERLLQDLHDGFGSQLSSARLMVAQGGLGTTEIHTLLSECMSDLHLVADTLGSQHKTLALALADLRFRTDRRTAELPLQWHWNVSLETLPALPERSLLQILRIVQEAINNALKHAQATHITMEAHFDRVQQQLRISITDDGVGIPEGVAAGRGLHNMRQRARELGAQLHWLAQPQGTQVLLVWTPATV
jgi:signal transduction histidine kinase